MAIRLVSVRTGFTPEGNSAAMTPSASALLPTIFAVPPSALKRFARVRWYGVSPRRAAGNHTRVAPEEAETSTRVVTSNVRQPPPVASCGK